MELAQPIQVGHRVRMIRNANGLTKGMQGTVVRIVANTNCLDVRFENYPWPRLVYRGDLRLVEQQAQLEQG